MSKTAPTVPEISAEELATRMGAGEDLTVLDVRGDSSPGIEVEGVRVRELPADRAMFEAGNIAGEAPGPVVVVCNRGMTARPVAQAILDAGGEGAVLDGGLRAWLDLLPAEAVELGIPGLTTLQIQRPGRGCLSYLFAAEGRALVVDPTVDAAFYRDLADRIGARITDVVDTHLHADHISVARDLARAAGATLRLPRGTIERGIEFADEVEPLTDGQTFEVGEVEFRAVSLPGHTTDMTGLAVGGKALVSGDSLFAEGIARPDLERGDPDGAAAMARTLHATLHDRIMSLPDATIVLPGHTHPGLHGGPVTADLATVRRRVPELATDRADEFAAELVADLPPRPANYEEVIAVNAGRRAADPDLEQGGNSCATSAPTPAGG